MKSTDTEKVNEKVKTFSENGRCTKRFLNAGDTFISLFIISPLVITHWRGTWAYMDYKNDIFLPWNSFIFGMVLHTTIALLREFLYTQYSKSKKCANRTNWCDHRYIMRCLLTKCYAYVFSMACNMHWRGGWAVLDMYFGMNDNKNEFLSVTNSVFI